jgi:hypothetical protein
MTQPAVPLADPGNQLLTQTPAQLSTGLVDTSAGQRLALTIRTTSATLTVLLEHADATLWAGNLKRAAESMSSTGLIVAGGQIAPPADALAQRP